MATKERLAAMAASLCAVCSGQMLAGLVTREGGSELRTYVCAECGHTRTYSVDAN
jgi:DNA-directed RNA polymerase subunit RPC12/RpoP